MHENSILGSNYELIDSGNGQKLERFGARRIVRLSSLAIWPKRLSSKEWANYDAAYHPIEGWKFRSKSFESWDVLFNSLSLRLRLQTNGQVGLFPEHSQYLPQLIDEIKLRRNIGKEISVLSLFAFTGMASVLSAKLGATVVHVDIAKKALSWARENMELNKLPINLVRLVPEDSITYLKREVKRDSQYDIILIDPPSFSRGDKSKAWKLEEIIFDIIDCTLNLLKKKKGMLFFTCHHQAIDSDVLRNIFSSYEDRGISLVKSEALSIPEVGSLRRMPAGVLALIKYT